MVLQRRTKWYKDGLKACLSRMLSPFYATTEIKETSPFSTFTYVLMSCWQHRSVDLSCPTWVINNFIQQTEMCQHISIAPHISKPKKVFGDTGQMDEISKQLILMSHLKHYRCKGLRALLSTPKMCVWLYLSTYYWVHQISVAWLKSPLPSYPPKHLISLI